MPVKAQAGLTRTPRLDMGAAALTSFGAPAVGAQEVFMAVVVVESPAKAKTINKYLGSDYTVLASYGHVRDLPAKDGSVDPEQDFDMEWEVAADSKKHVRAIAEALKTDDELILATDPDREGEAISWHLKEALASSLKKARKSAALPSTPSPKRR